jgi:nucleoid-associated protein YgaU
MAIVVLVLWLFTAGAGFTLLANSNFGRSRPEPAPSPHLAAVTSAAAEAPAAAAEAEAPAAAAEAPAAAAEAPAAAAEAPAAAAEAPAAAQASAAHPVPEPRVSKRELRRAARDRFDPPSLTAAKNAPMMPGLRPLLEFAHPAFAAIGLGFWLGFTMVHNRVLGWIAFGLVTATVCLGLTWFTANARAAKAKRRDQGEPPPSFGIRLVVLHGGAATVTFVLAALTALVLNR